MQVFLSKYNLLCKRSKMRQQLGSKMNVFCLKQGQDLNALRTILFPINPYTF